VVSVVFEHVRRPITVAEVHGGSMRLALRLSVGSHAIICLRGLRVILRVTREHIMSLPAGITSDVGVEHRDARQRRMLVAPAARGTLGPRRDAGFGRRTAGSRLVRLR
jgi:hypothetical protein